MIPGLGAAAEMVKVLLLGSLFAVYVKNHREIRTKYTMGLLLFAGFFLAEATLAVLLYTATGMCQQIGLEQQVRPVLSTIEALGLLALVWITWK